MPYSNLNPTMNRLLIGVSCLERKDQSALANAWNQRFPFHQHNAFLIEVNSDADRNCVLATVCDRLKQQGFRAIDAPVVLAVFADVQKPEQSDFLARMNGLDIALTDVLFCGTRAMFFFAYVGNYRLFAPRAELKQRIEALTANESSAKTILVGCSALVDCDWSAETAFLDVYCRSDDGIQSRLAPGTLGFLRYACTSALKWNEQQDQLERTARRLGRNGEITLKQAIDNLVAGVAEELERDCSPVKGAHPVAPGLLLTRGQRRAAEKGRDPSYNKALESTISAVEQTGKSIVNYCAARRAAFREQADDLLHALITQTEAGIELLKDRETMEQMLNRSSTAQDARLELSGKYTMEELQSAIYDYLREVLRQELDCTKEALVQELKNAYHSLDLNRLECEYQEEYSRCQRALSETPDPAVFLRRVVQGDENGDSVFSPTNVNLTCIWHPFLIFSRSMTDVFNRLDDGRVTALRMEGGTLEEVVTPFFYTNVQNEGSAVLNHLLMVQED